MKTFSSFAFVLVFALLAIGPQRWSSTADAADQDFVGSVTCATCHPREYDTWLGSHHDRAMAEATPQTVLGDFGSVELSAHGVTSTFYEQDGHFFVRTDGPGGELHDYPIKFTFGWYPLQQYLVEFPRGHLQALGLAWDRRPVGEGGQRWFHLYPDEPMDHRHPLHWSGREQTWNYQCAECHSTGLEKNYDLATDSYRTRWAEINVACEACHGPGAAHLAWAKAAGEIRGGAETNHKGLAMALKDRDGATWDSDAKTGKPRRSRPRQHRTEIELCARCHSRRAQIWDDYEYGKPLHDTHRLALLDDTLYFPDGQIKDEVYVYGSFIQSRMYRAGVTCSDCHEPHSLQLRAPGNGLCTRCHLPAQYDTEAHHHHLGGSKGAACTGCHMPQRAYMVVDERADHSMRIPRPDLSVAMGTPNACNQCHDDRTAEWAAEITRSWRGARPPPPAHYGETLHAARRGAGDATDRLLALAADRDQPGIARATALELLYNQARPNDRLTIERLLTDDDALVRRAAAGAPPQPDLAARVKLLLPLIEDPARTVRMEAARLLAPLLRYELPAPGRNRLLAAIKEYSHAQVVSADRPESHLNLGNLARALGNLRTAEEAYRTALRLQPGFAPAYANLADLFRQQGREDEGEAALRSGLTELPDAADLHHALGLLLVRKQRLDEALVPLQRATALAPERPRYAYAYALALRAKGEPEKAITTLEAARRDHPGDREVQIALTELYLETGDGAAAIKVAEDLRVRYPNDPQAKALWEQASGPPGQRGRGR